MALALPVILLASSLMFQATPTTPSATTPAGSPLPSKGKLNAKGVNSELEGETAEDGVMSFSKYEGGNFALKPAKITTYVNESNIVLVQGKQRFAIPAKSVAEVLGGSGAYARVGVAMGATVTNSSPKNNQTVVGIVWKDGDKKNGVVLRVDKGDFDTFLSALQNVTGMQAINTDAK
jgi:hypothetical protein